MTTYKLTFTQELKDTLTNGWQGEVDADNWEQADVDRDIAKIEGVDVGTVITFSDDEPRPEEEIDFDGSQYTPEQLIVVGWEYFGYPSMTAVNFEQVD